jgi:hypothetical protein
MGFTGVKAAYWRERYIQAFNLMEAELLKKQIVHAETRGRKPQVREDDRADPVKNGMFRMMPSGDNVDLAERNRRLVKAGN